jgi:hypothetical protein
MIRLLGGPVIYQQCFQSETTSGIQTLHFNPFGVRVYQVARTAPALVGIQSRYLHPFDIRVSQVYNPEVVDETKGIQYHYLHPFVKPLYLPVQLDSIPVVQPKGLQYYYFHQLGGRLYLPVQVDGEYEIVEPPVDSPTYMGGRIGLHRSMKKKGKFDEQDIRDVIDILTLMDIC